MNESYEDILKKAQKKAYFFCDELIKKLEALKYPNIDDDRIGSLQTGIIDIYESFCEIYKYYLPLIIDKKNFNKEQLADALFNLNCQLDHIKWHIEEIGDNIVLIYRFLDENNDNNSEKDLKNTKEQNTLKDRLKTGFKKWFKKSI